MLLGNVGGVVFVCYLARDFEIFCEARPVPGTAGPHKGDELFLRLAGELLGDCTDALPLGGELSGIGLAV